MSSLLKRSIWSAPFPALPTSPQLCQALGKGHIPCSQTNHIYLWWTRWGKGLFGNGAPKGINMAPLFTDPRLDNPVLHPLQALNDQYLFLPWFGFFCPSIFAALCLSDTLPLGRCWALPGTVKCKVYGYRWCHWNCFSVFPKLSFAFWLYPSCTRGNCIDQGFLIFS